MLAVDTNIVVRYLIADDPAQFARSWVLRSAYRYGPTQVARALRGLAGLPSVTMEDIDVAGIALQWLERGLDFADSLHLARAQSCDAFITFDQDLVARAVELSAIPVQLPGNFA
jgi:predicted nucleic-acid-binding protein